MHLMKVNMFGIDNQHGFQPFFAHVGVEVDFHPRQRIVTDELQVQEMLFERAADPDVRERGGAVADVIDIAVEAHGSPRREGIGSLSLSLDLSSDPIERVVWHEMGWL